MGHFNQLQGRGAVDALCDSCSANTDWYRGYMLFNLPRISCDAQFIAESVAPNSRILDIGGVPPLCTEFLRINGFTRLTVADPHPEPFARYFDRMGISYHKTDLLKSIPGDLVGKFDVVCLNEVIEHLAGNLMVAIQNALLCVASGGRLFITTPNLRSFSGLVSLIVHRSGLASKPLDGVRAQYDRVSAEFGYYGHVREYTADEIVDLLGTFGCVLERKEFQPNYIVSTRAMAFARRLECVFPKWALFGKYMFAKTEKMP